MDRGGVYLLETSISIYLLITKEDEAQKDASSSSLFTLS